jgi:hypothetical protein
VSWYSSVGIATGWTGGVQFPAGLKIFLFSTTSSPALVPTKPPFQGNYYYYYYCYYWSTAFRWALADFSVSWSYTQPVGLLPRGISPYQGLYLHTEQHKYRLNAHNTDIHAFERAKTVHALDGAATVIGPFQGVQGKKRLGREADHSSPSSTQVKNVGIIPSLPRES